MPGNIKSFFFEMPRIIRSSNRLVEISAPTWHDVGRNLANEVSEKSCFAYRYDRAMYEDEPDIHKLWKEDLAVKAKSSMASRTPLAYDLCCGFDSIFTSRGEGFSVWELLTLYEVDMFLHEFHYKCRYCEKRIMQGVRYLCTDCNPTSTTSGSSTEDDSAKKKRARALKRGTLRNPEHISVCMDCFPAHNLCEDCGYPRTLTPTSVLHETSGVGIANKSGCTGFGYRDDSAYFCGQTLEMATDTYNYGRFDTIYKLNNTSSKVTVLVYDVGCILSPFGINSNRLGLCVFNLYNSDYSLPPYNSSEARVPMASLQWEILLRGSRTVKDAFDFLVAERIPTFTSASFIIAADGDTSVIEVTANAHWTPPGADDLTEDNQPSAIMVGKANNSRWICRANNCLAGSCLHKSESLPPNISSKHRQTDLSVSFNDRLSLPIDVAWAKSALSSPTIQTEYCLGTIVMEPMASRMHVRFRVGTRIGTTLKDGGKWEIFTI